MPRIPRKLKIIPIVEALFEVRFVSDQVPEVVLGKIAARDDWKDYKTIRLPLADVPGPIRDSDPNLANQPLWQLVAPNGQRQFKLGPRMFSCHALAPYPGWSVFDPELRSATDFLLGILGTAQVTRYGFRYVNAMGKAHFVSGLSDLNFAVRVADSDLTCPLNLNYMRTRTTNHTSIVRLAPKEFVQNPTPDLEVLVDIDIVTPNNFKSDGKDIATWVSGAHGFLKEEFFTLLPDALIDRLEEK